jgi:hypothetical protein
MLNASSSIACLLGSAWYGHDTDYNPTRADSTLPAAVPRLRGMTASGGTTIILRVDEAERNELLVRAEREKISLSDYIRVRLGLRGQGSADDAEIQEDAGYEALRAQLVDHDRRLQALESGAGDS